MYRFIEYTFFFVVLILLQVFLFDNLNLGMYVHPLVYVGFIVLLPMETPAVAVLLLGLVAGFTMDIISGGAGLNTSAALAVAFARRPVLILIAGREEVKEGGIPVVRRLGTGKYLKYCTVMVLLHCAIYFSLEALTWSYFYLTLLRIVLSAFVTLALLHFSQMLLPESYSRRQNT